MKILWITYGILGKANELFYGKKSQGGAWIEESANHLIPLLSSSSLTIISIGKENREIKDIDTGIMYVELGEIKKRRGVFKGSDTPKWKNLISRYNPDIIQVFGTEFSNGLNVVEAADNIPVIFYIQGIMASFEYYKFAGMNIIELIRIGGYLSLFKAYKYYEDYRLYKSQIPFESEMIKKCDGVIIDGNWSRLYLQKYNRDVNVFYQFLPVSSSFLNKKWNIRKCIKKSIFTIAGRTPYKGIQNIIKALYIVKQYYPDIKLYIPGNMSYSSLLTKSPFIEYLEKLIKNLCLQENIEFCGQLSADEMAEHMLKANLFVMPSCIENHSSSLREAMYLGVPCITSDVGCISEIARNRDNLLLYRYPEIDQLAGHILDILKDDNLAEKIGSNAFNDIRKKFPQDKIGTQIIENYKKVLSTREFN